MVGAAAVRGRWGALPAPSAPYLEDGERFFFWLSTESC